MPELDRPLETSCNSCLELNLNLRHFDETLTSCFNWTAHVDAVIVVATAAVAVVVDVEIVNVDVPPT